MAQSVPSRRSDRPVDHTARARAACAAAADRARRLGHRVLVSMSIPLDPLPDALTLAHQAAAVEAQAFFWQRPADRVTLIGIGAAATVETNGPGRFAEADAACDAVLADAVLDADGDAFGTGPLFVGGFAFADEPSRDGVWRGFPAGRLVLPRLTIAEANGTAVLTVNTLVAPDADPARIADTVESERARLRTAAIATANLAPDRSPARYEAAPLEPLQAWQEAVAATVTDIGAGRIDKLVLARTCTVRSTRPFECARVVRRLRDAYPACATFWVATPAGHFLGATPEPLVRLRGRTVSTAAVAGSIGRGTSPATDRALAGTLRGSRKDQREHVVVVRAMEAALAPLCEDLHVAAEPHLLQLPNVQHLVTPITGRLAEPRRILDLVARVHPSPAVAGHPREAALRLLRQREALDRGWYAGPVGWMNARHEGEFAVALRCALVRGTEAALFAGAGIVAGSDPEAELAETRLKLQPLLSALMEI